MTLPAEDMFICHMGDRYWRMIDSGSSTFGRIAQLQSVWWMDVAAVFYGVPKGRYKIQWRLKVTSDAPIINTDFRARFFEKHEVGTMPWIGLHSQPSPMLSYSSPKTFKHSESRQTLMALKPTANLSERCSRALPSWNCQTYSLLKRTSRTCIHKSSTRTAGSLGFASTLRD
ncbi:hypothetical protein B0O80DRAFT_233196 [Mortierella sp. GBAus27b]|nr:hypothetical protein B0O80DRAFT_233196 [Mortierella sp. GBAus27b]